MSIFRIFLCGSSLRQCDDGMVNWRSNISTMLHEEFESLNTRLKLFDPIFYYDGENYLQQNEKEVIQFNLCNIEKSDIVIVNINGIQDSIECIIEIYNAYKNNVPVIALDEYNCYNSLHPWIRECITRVENSMCCIVDYISDFYIL